MDEAVRPAVAAPAGVAAGHDLTITAQAGSVAAGVIGHLEVHMPAAAAPVRVRLWESMPTAPVALQPRAAVLARVREALDGGSVAAVVGGRGMGKTQLAAAYCRARDAEGWPVIVWLSAESRASVTDGLARLADRVGLRAAADGPDDAAAAALAWLSGQSGPGVVVFDDAEDPDLVAAWAPRSPGIGVLVTTTRQSFAALGAPIGVGAYDRDEAVAYLCRRTGLDDVEGAGRVADELGCLPVALAQAGALIGGARFPSFDTYLGRLRSADVAQALDRAEGDAYPQGFTQAVALALDDLDRVDPDGDARWLLDLLALLSPDGVPARMLPALTADLAAAPAAADEASDDPEAVADDRADPAGEGGAAEDGDDRAVDDEEWVFAHLETLIARSLVIWSAAREEVIVHRLLARVLREISRGDGSLDDLIWQAAKGLDTIRPTGEGHEVSHREVWRRLGPQVIALRANTPDTVGPDTMIPVLALTFYLAVHLMHAGDPRQAVEISTRLLADTIRVFGPDSTNTLGSRNNLAEGYRAMGRNAEALALHEQNLADCLRVLGPDHSDTLDNRHNLAIDYSAVGRYAEAIALDEQTLADRMRLFGPDHPDTLDSRSNLGSHYQAVGRTAEAILLHEQTLADRIRVLGPDHPDVLYSYGHLSTAYWDAGRHDESNALDERTLADMTRVLGPDHPTTMHVRSSLAEGYRSVGRTAEATALHEEVLAGRTRVLGPDHPDTLASRASVAEMYWDAGRHDESNALDEQTLADRLRVLGPDDPDTLMSRHNLAIGLKAVGRIAEAIALHEQNLADRLRVLGPDDPDTQDTRDRLDEARAAAQG